MTQSCRDAAACWQTVYAAMDRLRREDLSDDEAVGVLREAAGPLLDESGGVDEAGDVVDSDDGRRQPGHAQQRGLLDEHIGALLRAAFEGVPVPPRTASEKDLIRRERQLRSMSLDEAFQVLASLEPELGAIADEVSSGKWTTRVDSAEDDTGSSMAAKFDRVRFPLPKSLRRNIRASLEAGDSWARYERIRIDPLVGPAARDRHDELLRSGTAHQATLEHLRRLRGGTDHGGWDSSSQPPSVRGAWAEERRRRRRR